MARQRLMFKVQLEGFIIQSNRNMHSSLSGFFPTEYCCEWETTESSETRLLSNLGESKTES